MQNRLQTLPQALLLTVILALLLQPMAGIDFSSQTLEEPTPSFETGARAAQTEWVASAVQATGANTAQPNLVFPSSMFVDSNDNVITVGNLVADVTFGNVGVTTSSQLGFVALANSQGVWQWAETQGNYDSSGDGADDDGFSGVSSITQVGSDYYLCGWFSGNISFGNQNYRSTQDSQDIFVSKISSQGVYDWTITAGGPETDTCESMTSTVGGDVFAAGSFNISANFQSMARVSQGGFDGWFAQINTGPVTTGDRWSWVSTIGGTTDDYGTCVVTDGNNVYGCGWFTGTATFGSNQIQAIGQLDSYIVKMSMTGGIVDTAQAGATGGIVQVMDIIVDAGTIYSTGHLIGSANFGAHQAASSNGGQDRSVFVAALGSANNIWSWATMASGSYQSSTTIAMTGTGGLVVAGSFATLNAAGTQIEQTGSGQFGSTTLSAKYIEGFVAGLSTTGAWDWAEGTDGAYFDSAMSVGVMSTGTIVAMGDFGGGGVQSGQTYSINLGTSSVSGTGNAYTEQNGLEVGMWVWAIMGDTDGDGVGDSDDNCLMTPNMDQSDIDGDLIGDVCDDDIDGDGKLNDIDDCDGPSINWDTNDTSIDMDQDGCLDSTEDTDDDGDGIADVADPCTGPSFKQQWSSTNANDYDADGCHDSEEDDDDDNDGIDDDAGDDCVRGWHNWTSDATTDHDSDGCADAGEDPDDDNDGVNDKDSSDLMLDLCRLGELGWISDATNDRDGDGCKDLTEDNDDDQDDVSDGQDNCPTGAMDWTSVPSTDLDGDGCRDLDEDDDDDGDTVLDVSDGCPMGMTNWISDALTDLDGDGCRDLDEDLDDDADGFLDQDDGCPQGETDWFSTVENDFDRDGCRDATEDGDDDGDSVTDDVDQCPFTPVGESIDVVGCGWLTQQDHDVDGVWDHLDNCQTSPSQLIRETFQEGFGVEVDEIGCWAGESDSDDDGKLLYIDDCPNTPATYRTQTQVDGCHISEYDVDEDGVTGDMVHPNGNDQCLGTSNSTTRDAYSTYGGVDFGCWYGDDDSDEDDILLYLDQCSTTPAEAEVLTEGELTGCAASERDEDDDSVMTDVDVCLDTPSGVEVEKSGDYAGCSLEERVELGDTSAILEKNIIWVILGSVIVLLAVVVLTLSVLRRGGSKDVAEVSWDDEIPMAPPGFDAPAVAQVISDYTQLPGGGSYSTGPMGETIYNAPDGSAYQMQTDGSFIRV
jgi:hypothetical protein